MVKSMFQPLVLGLSLMLLTNAAKAQDWELVKDEEGIKV